MGTRFKGDTKDPVVNITTWCLLVVMILSVLSRLGTKIRLFRQLIVDDLLIITSLVRCPIWLPKYCLQHQFDTLLSTQVFGVGQSVAVSLAVGSGYGKHLKDVTKDDLDHMMKVISGTVFYFHVWKSKTDAVIDRKSTPRLFYAPWVFYSPNCL